MKQKIYDAFISFSSLDQKVAEGVCGYLEGNGIRCFVSYRDIPKGAIWADAIFKAVSRSRLMVAVFSKDFNDSKFTQNEITLASKFGVPIVPFRIRPDEPTGGIGFFFANLNWIDAFPEPDKCFGQLLNDIKLILKGQEESDIRPKSPESILAGNTEIPQVESRVIPEPSPKQDKIVEPEHSTKPTTPIEPKPEPLPNLNWMSIKKKLMRYKRLLILILVFLVILFLILMLPSRCSNQQSDSISPQDSSTMAVFQQEDSIDVVDTIETIEPDEPEDVIDTVIVKEDLEHATKNRLEELANHGNAEAQYWLGCYYYNLKLKGKASMGASWWLKSADAGYVPAMNRIAQWYRDTEDYSKSVKYYKKAADEKSPEAMFGLWYNYYNGCYEGHAKKVIKFGEAIKWLRQASDLGYARAQFQLGIIYYRGEFIQNGKNKPKDSPEWKKAYKTAFGYFTQAAEHENAESEEFIGECYHYLSECYNNNSLGTIKDSKKAKEYVILAKQKGYKK